MPGHATFNACCALGAVVTKFTRSCLVTLRTQHQTCSVSSHAQCDSVKFKSFSIRDDGFSLECSGKLTLQTSLQRFLGSPAHAQLAEAYVVDDAKTRKRTLHRGRGRNDSKRTHLHHKTTMR